jgi:glycosyltransferase involved in cell wall biosynthesis
LLEHGFSSIIIVDDGSSKPVQQTIAGLSVTLLRHKLNLGQGAALQTGFDYAKKAGFDIVITFDADGQHKVNDLPVLIKPILENKADVVLGSRFLFPNKTNFPFFKKTTLQTARIINFLLSGILLSDAHNGLRALNKTALEKINLTENRMAHASEILFEIKKQKLRYTEVPVNVLYTDYSRQKGQSPRDSIKVLFDVVLHKLFK